MQVVLVANFIFFDITVLYDSEQMEVGCVPTLNLEST